MNDRSLDFPPVILSGSMPEPLPTPKFQIGQQICWANVPAHDFGCIIGFVWATAASTQANGYHYAVQLDAASPSQQFGIDADWGFEDDLALLPAAGLPNSDGHPLDRQQEIP